MAGTEDDPNIDPLDDSRWCPFKTVHRLLRRRLTGDPWVAAVDMTEAFATEVPTMKRSRMYWADREILSFQFWNDHELHWTGDRLVPIRCPAYPLARIDIIEFAGYAWLPKLAERWPTVFASMLPSPAPPVVESQSQEPPPNAPPRPDTGAEEREQRSEVVGAPAATEGRDAITDAATAVPEPVAGTVKAYFRNHPQRRNETGPEYINRLFELSKPRWRKKTLQNVFYESRRRPRD